MRIDKQFESPKEKEEEEREAEHEEEGEESAWHELGAEFFLWMIPVFFIGLFLFYVIIISGIISIPFISPFFYQKPNVQSSRADPTAVAMSLQTKIGRVMLNKAKFIDINEDELSILWKSYLEQRFQMRVQNILLQMDDRQVKAFVESNKPIQLAISLEGNIDGNNQSYTFQMTKTVLGSLRLPVFMLDYVLKDFFENYIPTLIQSIGKVKETQVQASSLHVIFE